MSKFLNQEERVWLMKQVSGSTPQDTIGQLRRDYYISYVGGTIPSSLTESELEYRWMLKYIADNGGTVVDSDNYSDLWKKMVMVLGLTPSRHIDQNKLVFYSNAS